MAHLNEGTRNTYASLSCRQTKQLLILSRYEGALAPLFMGVIGNRRAVEDSEGQAGAATYTEEGGGVMTFWLNSVPWDPPHQVDEKTVNLAKGSSFHPAKV